MNGIGDSMDMSLSKFWEMVKDREAWRAAVHRDVRVGHNSATKQQQQYNSNIFRNMHKDQKEIKELVKVL